MQAAKRVAQLLDLGLGNILFVFRAGELFGNLIQIAQHSFERFANTVNFSPSLLQRGTLVRWNVRIGRSVAMLLLSFSMGMTALLWGRRSLVTAAVVPSPIASPALHATVAKLLIVEAQSADGPVTLRLTTAADGAVDAQAWGPGAAAGIAGVPRPR